MSAPVSGASGNALVGMLLLEHQQQLVKEGSANRDMAHEVGVAAKKVEMVFTQLQSNERDVERTLSYVKTAMSAYSAAGSVKEAATTDKSAKVQNDEANEAAHKPKPNDKSQILDGVMDYVKNRAEKTDKDNGKWSESMQKIREGAEKLAEKIGETSEKDQELANEMFKMASVFSRAG